MKKLAALDKTLVLDLLGERLAFERTAARLYENALSRVRASSDGMLRRAEPKLARIRHDEGEHASWLERRILELGGDPGRATPRARLADVRAEGIVQLALAPESPLATVVDSLLAAELLDHSGWNVLINLAAEAHDDEAQDALRDRLNSESEHLHILRTLALAIARRDLLRIETDVSRKAA